VRTGARGRRPVALPRSGPGARPRRGTDHACAGAAPKPVLRFEAMVLNLHVLTDAALELDPADRLELASALIDSVEGVIDPSWEPAWTDELRRRSEAADARAVRGAPWAELRSRLLREIAGE
jgi:hypothetical protein